ncbi:MAG: hypothetical protein LBF15_03025 [Candidatus Peribacteria bacterium]|jgi:hypothetical protein|nr:hypothetical protein [Candidatus Peribacteria bacterium]
MTSYESIAPNIQSGFKNVATSVLSNAVVVLSDEIEKKKLLLLTNANKKSMTMYVFLRNIIERELSNR